MIRCLIASVVTALFISAENTVAFMGGDSMKLNIGNSTQILMTFTMSMVAAIGSAAGATIWQSFGKPKVEKIAEENSKPKRKIGFIIEEKSRG